MLVISKIFCSFLIVYFIFFSVFWADCKHTAILCLLKYSRKAIVYLGLWHTWAVFSNPWKANRTLLLDVEYDTGEKEIFNLFDCENMIFFDRKSDTFDEKYAESLFLCKQVRSNFVYYIKSYIEKSENKKIKKIEFVEENKEIKLWNPNAGSSNFIGLSSHKL